ncbi:conserved protein of unknown function [Candidatus Promineifilum breve]|uniref:BrnT family toxin n=1 Tax=Candidatus Promineifilum breve TaxID=1806508 RepID=A0A160T6S7_9CHLR|nr:BrnT family toxin [Candidatus Promineifilum breve]CUS04520.2 conserved protein of unknown function [Candidatus Promineifilum breve]
MASESKTTFEWDAEKEQANLEKHGISFTLAQYAFTDSRRIILEDVTHSTETEKRYFCLGKVGEGVVTVRFTYREGHIRIFGAGYWRKGKQIYDRQNRLH